MKLAWITDIHLDFLEAADIDRFHNDVRDSGADAILLGGDIAQAPTWEAATRQLADAVQKPVWFVLGNHDYYGGSIADVRARAVALSAESHAVWLGTRGVVELSPTTALVGHDGWGDARIGDANSELVLNDFVQISDLRLADRASLIEVLRRLGEESAEYIRRSLTEALSSFEQVIVLTHVPPFRESSWHEGQISSEEYLPFFACGATGAAILGAARLRPDRRVTVLCGHTHSGGECQPLPNVRVVTGPAVYGKPAVQWPLLDA